MHLYLYRFVNHAVSRPSTSDERIYTFNRSKGRSASGNVVCVYICVYIYIYIYIYNIYYIYIYIYIRAGINMPPNGILYSDFTVNVEVAEEINFPSRSSFCVGNCLR